MEDNEDLIGIGPPVPPQIDNGPAVPPFAHPTIDPNICPICKWRHLNDFTPDGFDFDSSQSGLTLGLDEIEEGKEIEFFHYLLDYDLVAHIAAETNRYCREYLKENAHLPEFSKGKRWVNTTPDELYCFFGVFLLMPHCRKNTLKSYWTTDPLLLTPFFPKMFSQDRFLLLLRMLHFNDNSFGQGG
uniref:PiggyBac transposable element-derived protein domain-containing protein n=1 Tax=Clastoptera arizonana TaxID=38151 RepID=A0A1B6E0J2_9HEMI